MSVQSVERHEIHLEEFIHLVWRSKWFILAVTGVITAVTAVVAWSMPSEYQATVIVSPVTNSSSGGGSRLAASVAQLGGLASLAGISVEGDNRRAEALAILQSEALTQKYIADNNLLTVLFSDKWDSVAEKWKVGSREPVPTLWKANRLFEQRIRTVVDDKKSGMVKLTITWTDPQLAAKWANDLVALTNSYLRNKAIAESERHMAYLSDQATKTDIAHVRDAIYDVLETEIKNVMMAKGTDEYALKVMDPALPAEQRYSPKRFLWLGGGVLGGLFLSILIVVVRATWQKS
jgi:uncharacterized protein involved in exopolysaccharide biosynthesis